MPEYIEREAVSADSCGDADKIKTPFAQIIVGGTVEKPYYSILWWDTEKKEGHIGYSSYFLEYVFKWLKEEFEVTEDLISADVAPVVHGRWIRRGNEKKCSVCGFIYYSNNDEWSGCPNCLAKMDGR